MHITNTRNLSWIPQNTESVHLMLDIAEYHSMFCVEMDEAGTHVTQNVTSRVGYADKWSMTYNNWHILISYWDILYKSFSPCLHRANLIQQMSARICIYTRIDIRSYICDRYRCPQSGEGVVGGCVL